MTNSSKLLCEVQNFKHVSSPLALHNYLKAKLHIVTAEFSKARISSLLQDKEVNSAVIKDFVGLLEDCEAARYAPATSVRMQEDFDRASGLISKMDKQL